MKHKIIIESGSTKTSWVFVNDSGQSFSLTREGYNPVYYAPSVLENMISGLNSGIDATGVSHIFYYGAGCSADESKRTVMDSLQKFFPLAQLEIHHDLFGAARALFGNGSGIASILGTGSSTCLIQNSNIKYAVPSLGFLLADEGSGMHLGKLLLNAYFKNDLPIELHQAFEEKYGKLDAPFITALYARQKANAYIASFAPFVIGHHKNPTISKLIGKAFRIFFEENILKYPDYHNYNLGFVGSIAWLLREHLHEIAQEYDLHINKIIQNPVQELIDYHSKS